MDERLSTMTFSCFPTCMRAIPELDQWHLSPFSFLLLSNKPDHLTSLLSPYDLFPLYVEYNARPPWSSPSLPLQHHLLLIVPLLTMPQPHSFFSNPHPRIGMFINFREREVRGGERERSMWEGNIDWLPPGHTLDWTLNIGMCPDSESNLQPFGVWDDAPINCATWPGPSQPHC